MNEESPIERFSHVSPGGVAHDPQRENAWVDIVHDWDARLRRIEELLERMIALELCD